MDERELRLTPPARPVPHPSHRSADEQRQRQQQHAGHEQPGRIERRAESLSAMRKKWRQEKQAREIADARVKNVTEVILRMCEMQTFHRRFLKMIVTTAELQETNGTDPVENSPNGS